MCSTVYFTHLKNNLKIRAIRIDVPSASSGSFDSSCGRWNGIRRCEVIELSSEECEEE
jgi:hypothetical protein